MRLLNVHTLHLEEFHGSGTPSYSILSHTWGKDEVLFQDVLDSTRNSDNETGRGANRPRPSWGRKKGAHKVIKSAALAAEKGFDYIWIDTCCIDKASSSELSEAINSMFKWYSSANLCLAYIADYSIRGSGNLRGGQRRLGDFDKSRWFTRGWTLQELIAPPEVMFYDQYWILIGPRTILAPELHGITKIDIKLLQGNGLTCDMPDEMYCLRLFDGLDRFEFNTLRLKGYSVSHKTAWAASRETTREEDIAYCLLGIFDINMPLLYGEGRKAFQRLQKKIIKKTNDQSILAFHKHRTAGLLARSPRDFVTTRFEFTPIRTIGKSIRWEDDKITIDLLLCPARDGDEANKLYLGILDCLAYDRDADDSKAMLMRPAIVLTQSQHMFLAYPLSLKLVWSEMVSDRPLFSLGNDFSRLRVDFDKTEEKKVVIHERGSAVWEPSILRLHPIRGHPPLYYQFGPSFPARTGAVVELTSREIGVGRLKFFASIEQLSMGQTSYPWALICLECKGKSRLIPLIIENPSPNYREYMTGTLLEEEETRTKMLTERISMQLARLQQPLPEPCPGPKATQLLRRDRNLPSASCYRYPISPSSGLVASVRIDETRVLGLSVYDLHLEISTDVSAIHLQLKPGQTIWTKITRTWDDLLARLK